MKRPIVVLSALALILLLALVVNAGMKSSMELKAGDQVYACTCGEKCPCDTMSNNEGKCTCGVEMAKAKVLKAGEDKATLQVGGEEREFDTVAKYACACGPSCPCNTISQNPGKCTCGVKMKAVQPE